MWKWKNHQINFFCKFVCRYYSITGFIVEQSHFVENAVDVDVSFLVIGEVPAFVFGYLFRGNAMFGNTDFTVWLEILSGLYLPMVMVGIDLIRVEIDHINWLRNILSLWTRLWTAHRNVFFYITEDTSLISEKSGFRVKYEVNNHTKTRLFICILSHSLHAKRPSKFRSARM